MAVQVISGSCSRTISVGGYSVGRLRNSFEEILSIPPDHRVYVGTTEVDDTHIVEDGTMVQFVRRFGSKGALEPDERALIERLEQKLNDLGALLNVVAGQRMLKEWYTTKEVAELMGRKEYTVREWCRLGRVNGKKVAGGRGNEGEWRVCHEELLRIQNKGLLPVPRRYADR